MRDIFSSHSGFKNKICCGVDEVGRGPLAGPVVAAAVILPEGFLHSEIKDSKKLNREKIKEVAHIIKDKSLAYAIGLREPDFIDKNDILTATFLAMQDAVLNLKIKPQVVLIDGNHTNPYLKDFEQIAVVDGDDKIIAISAASIIAKDFRDTLMEEYAHLYPEYGFEKHKGYGTSFHRKMIVHYGMTPIHRKSFCKKFLQDSLSRFF